MSNIAAPLSYCQSVTRPCLRVEDARGNYFIINGDIFRGNVAHARRLIGGDVRIMQVVKGNGYGLGVERAVALGLAAGIDGFCTGTPEEAVRAKAAAPSADILLFTASPPHSLADLVDKDVVITINSLEALRVLVESGASGRFYFELECGFGRFGLNREALSQAAALYLKQEKLNLAGVYTHFGQYGDEKLDNGLAAFDTMLGELRDQIPHDFETMAAGTHTILQRPSLPYSAVDPGRLLYGIVPPEAADEFKPVVVEVGSTVIQLNKVEAGNIVTIGYGNQADFSHGGKTAIFPMGWHDGLSLSRELSEVIVSGHKCPVIGRTLLHSIIDVSAIGDVTVGERVLLVQEQEKDGFSWPEAAGQQAMSTTELHFKLLGAIAASATRSP